MQTGKIFALAVINILGALAAFAQTWTQTSAINTNWASLASSADGSILYASGGTTNYHKIFASTNSGDTWFETDQPATNSFYCLATSADGTRVVAARNLPPNTPANSTNDTPFFISTNQGASWTAFGEPTTNWTLSVAMSADGQFVVGGMMQRNPSKPGYVCLSTNSGNTWSSRQVPTIYATPCVTATSDGRKLSVLISTNSDYINCLLTTTNAGLTWVTNTITDASLNYHWQSLASSADGTVLIVAGTYRISSKTYACVSTNAGVSWTPQLLTSKMYIPGSVAASADGTRLALVSFWGPSYISTNSGMSWQSVSPNTNWQSVVSSADGGLLVACTGASLNPTNGIGGIWTCSTTPSPVLGLDHSATNLTLAWTIPSTNFVLQYTPDLTASDWLEVTNVPVLHLTNLKNQVTLPLPADNAFYRLKTP
jgi:hypothetical protein